MLFIAVHACFILGIQNKTNTPFKYNLFLEIHLKSKSQESHQQQDVFAYRVTGFGELSWLLYSTRGCVTKVTHQKHSLICLIPRHFFSETLSPSQAVSFVVPDAHTHLQPGCACHPSCAALGWTV